MNSKNINILNVLLKRKYKNKKGSIVVPDNVVSNAKTDSSIFSDDEEDSNGYDISIKGDSDLNLNDSENGYDISIN